MSEIKVIVLMHMVFYATGYDKQNTNNRLNLCTDKSISASIYIKWFSISSFIFMGRAVIEL